MAAKHEEEQVAVSPMGEILNNRTFNLCVHCVVEVDKPVDVSQAKISICEILLSHCPPRFSSIVRRNEKGVLQWEKTEVNVDDHVFVPHFPPHLTTYDKYVEEYVSDMHLRKLPLSRPLWEFHFLNYKTTNGEATAILNLHHMLGDGSTFAYLARVCSTSPLNRPTLPPTFNSTLQPTQIHKISHSTPRPAQIHKMSQPAPRPTQIHRNSQTTWFGLKFNMYRMWHLLYSVVVVMWYTLHDLVSTLIGFIWMEDSKFPVRGPPGVELLPKDVASTTFTLQDIRNIKNCVGGTVNDVIMGVVFYGFRQYCQMVIPDLKELENLRVTAIALMNTRSRTGLKDGEDMSKSKTGTPHGNSFGFLQLRVPMKKLEDPLEYVRRAKHMTDKKKMSLAIFLTRRVIGYITRFRGSKTFAKVMYNTLANTTLAVTNVSGPTEQMSFAGYTVKTAGFSVSGFPQTILVTCLSYVGNMRLQVITTHGYVDANKLSKCFEDAFLEIRDASLSL